MSFFVGQKVVALVSNSDKPNEFQLGLTRGEVYTIGETTTHPSTGEQGVRVQEIAMPDNTLWFYAKLFRPVVERRTDIAIFTKLLDRAPNKQSEQV